MGSASLKVPHLQHIQAIFQAQARFLFAFEASLRIFGAPIPRLYLRSLPLRIIIFSTQQQGGVYTLKPSFFRGTRFVDLAINERRLPLFPQCITTTIFDWRKKNNKCGSASLAVFASQLRRAVCLKNIVPLCISRT